MFSMKFVTKKKVLENKYCRKPDVKGENCCN